MYAFLDLPLPGQLSQFYHWQLGCRISRCSSSWTSSSVWWNRAFPVKYLEPCPAGGHVLLNCGHHCAHARQSLATPPIWSGQNVIFCHFLGACGELTMPYHVKYILLLCNDLAYSTTLHWTVTCAVCTQSNLHYLTIDIALQFIVYMALSPRHPSIPSQSTYCTTVLHPCYFNPFEFEFIQICNCMHCEDSAHPIGGN